MSPKLQILNPKTYCVHIHNVYLCIYLSIYLSLRGNSTYQQAEVLVSLQGLGFRVLGFRILGFRNSGFRGWSKVRLPHPSSHCPKAPKGSLVPAPLGPPLADLVLVIVSSPKPTLNTGVNILCLITIHHPADEKDSRDSVVVPYWEGY